MIIVIRWRIIGREPDYVRINKIKGCCATFSSSDNLPKEIEGTLQIKSNEIKFNGPFPSRLDAL